MFLVLLLTTFVLKSFVRTSLGVTLWPTPCSSDYPSNFCPSLSGAGGHYSSSPLHNHCLFISNQLIRISGAANIQVGQGLLTMDHVHTTL